jgi:hypothetical protein
MGNKVKFEEYMQGSYSYNAEKLTEFHKQFPQHPDRSLDGCDGVFLAACRVRVMDDVKKSLLNAEEKGESQEDRISFLISHYEHERDSHAKWPRRSTSVTANFIHTLELCAIAEILELMVEWAKD